MLDKKEEKARILDLLNQNLLELEETLCNQRYSLYFF